MQPVPAGPNRSLGVCRFGNILVTMKGRVIPVTSQHLSRNDEACFAIGELPFHIYSSDRIGSQSSQLRSENYIQEKTIVHSTRQLPADALDEGRPEM